MSRPESPWGGEVDAEPTSLPEVELLPAWVEAVLDDPRLTPWQRDMIRNVHRAERVTLSVGRQGGRTFALDAYLAARQRAAERLARRRRLQAAWGVVWRWAGVLALVVVCVAVGLSVAP